jgi:CheY-like chemotaxis protein
MDIQLAGEMDGTQAAEKIHELYDIPVVYLTAFSDDLTLNRAKNAEPFGYMLKPFEEKKLHATIEIALYKHQIDKEKEQLKAQLSQARKIAATSLPPTSAAPSISEWSWQMTCPMCAVTQGNFASVFPISAPMPATPLKLYRQTISTPRASRFRQKSST